MRTFVVPFEVLYPKKIMVPSVEIFFFCFLFERIKWGGRDLWGVCLVEIYKKDGMHFCRRAHRLDPVYLERGCVSKFF